MRRPSFCCDQHGSGETQCQPQEGGESTLARVRRFLAVSMGARAAGRSPTTRCKHRALPPDPLHAPAHAVHSLLAEMKEAGVGVQGVLGRPLEDVMAAHGEDASGHGVPALVHLLCCYLLTHGVDYDTLVSEDWCAEEVRTRLLLERGAAGLPSDAPEPPPGSDAAVATGLLRLFLDELPHALIPPSAATKILQLLTERGPVALPESGNLCEEALGVAVVPRRLLHRHLPLHSLCLLRYLTAFIHQLRTSNHNTCPVPVSALSRVLARVMVAAGDDNGGRGDDDDDDRRPQESQPRLANRLGEILILCYNDIFQNTDDDGDDLSDSVSSPSSVGECVGDGDEDDDDEGDTTTTDTDDFRSPPVSPQKTARPRGTATSVVRPPPLSLHQPPMSPRSTREVVDHLDSIRPKVAPYSKELLVGPGVGPLLSPASPDDSLPSTQDEDEDATSQREPSLGLSELLNAGEPVTSDRGSWGMRESSHCDSWHRTAPRYSRFDDESTMQSNWYRSDEDDIILSPRASEAFKDVGPANGSDDYKTPPGQGAVKILMKNINSIKKKIKRYEEEFESAFGYRPSHSEKMKHKEIKKYMSELSKARKELKQMKDDVAGMMSVPTVFPLSLLRCQESTNPNARPKNTSGTADTIRQVEDRLREKRSASGRPTELTNMNKTEMQEEKTALQKALLYYESVHGRPTTREDRDLARPLYDRYRQVKRIVMRSSSRAKENMVELAPILEHEAMDFTLASPQHRGSLQGDEIEKISLPPSPPSTPPVFESPVFEAPQMTTTTTTTTTMPGDDPKDTRRGVPLGDLHALPLSELRERKKEARDEKKKLRRALREFEENFERDLGRKVQKEDRGPMEQTYLDYKHAKAKLRLLEALLSKHEPHKV
nr:uncharacterized protein LOC113806028 isoform X4 [Penaeus vannamei]